MGANLSFVTVMILNRYFQMQLPVTLVVWGRCCFALALILPFLEWKDLRPLWPLHLLRGSIVSAAMLCSYTAYRHLPVHLAVLIGATSPMFTMIFARIFLQESIDKKRWIAVFLGYLGVMILVHESLNNAWNSSILWAVLGNIFAAMAAVLSRWLVLQGVGASASMLYGTVVPFTLFSLLITLDPQVEIAHLSWKQWKILALLGSIGAMIQYATFRAYGVVKASFVAPLEYTRLCLMIPAGYLFLGEVPSLGAYMGGGLIAVISLCFVLWERKKN